MKVVVDNSTNENEVRNWLNTHKEEQELTWPQISKLTDVASPTLSLFSSAKYGGDNDKIARKICAYRDRLTAQAAISGDLPLTPRWYDTATSARLLQLLRWAQSGKIVLIVTGPGLGKTRAAERFAANDPNVWLATMSPSTAGVATMAIEVAEAIGLGEVKGSPQQISRSVKNRVRGKNGLLIIDEAQELTDKALNELRGWHDRTGLGIALLGNEIVVGQIEGRKSALAQISSRFSIRHVQAIPMPGDLDALFDGWGITDTAQRDFLAKVGKLPGALREVTNTIEIALMAAFGIGEPLSLSHLRNAAKQRHTKVGVV